MTAIIPHRQIHSGPQSWVPFLIATTLFIGLCLKGGFFGFIGEYPLNLPMSIFGLEPVTLPAGQFIVLFSMTWVLCLAMLLLFPRHLSVTKSSLLLLALSLVFRLALLPHEPSDDINRYLWEGRMLAEGISPYHYAPDDPALAELARDDPFHAHINHPTMPAIYPPLILYIFSFAVHIYYSPWMIKALLVLFDMATIWFILMLLRHRGLPIRWAILYAFNPVILYGFAGQGHLDVIQILFLMGAIYFYDRKLWARMFLFAGLAVQSKYVAAAAIPFLVRRDNFRYLWITIAAIILPYFPLVNTEWRQLFFSLREFGSEFAFNGSIHGVLRAAFGSIHSATDVSKILLVLSLLVGIWVFHPERNLRFRDNPVSGCFFSFGVLLLLSPTVHFWYISWVLPFIVLRPSRSWILLSLTISGYFVSNGIFHHTGVWRLPIWVQVVEWLPFYVLILFEAYLFWQRTRYPLDEESPQSVSVIIPVRNEAERIGACIEAIYRDNGVIEVIVVDGASTDQTAELAERAGARVIRHSAWPEKGGGRGGQIRAGIREARGDVVAVVHADTMVTYPTFTNVLDVLGKEPMIVGGAVGGTFGRPDWKLRLIEVANDFRMAFLGISFGDQVQFFRRKPVVEKNLFPDLPLMEDVEFSLRLHRLGRQVFFFGDVVISARRWQAQGLRNSISIIRRVTSYLWHRIWGEPDTHAMYNSYYGTRSQERRAQ